MEAFCGILDWDEPLVRASGDEAKSAAEWLESQHSDIDAKGIQTNAWRESEWCLFADEDLEVVTSSIEESDWSNLDVVRTGFAIHLMEPHLSKGSGLELILKRMGLDASDLLSVGDAPNDLSMFAMSGWSVAVGTPFADVRDAADVVSPIQTVRPSLHWSMPFLPFIRLKNYDLVSSG